MGNNQGNNTTQNISPSQENQLRKDLLNKIQQDCQRYSQNGEISYEYYQNILNIFSDYNLIHLRKSPLSRIIFKDLDKNVNNKVYAQELIQLLNSFYLISKKQTFITKERFLQYTTYCFQAAYRQLYQNLTRDGLDKYYKITDQMIENHLEDKINQFREVMNEYFNKYDRSGQEKWDIQSFKDFCYKENIYSVNVEFMSFKVEVPIYLKIKEQIIQMQNQKLEKIITKLASCVQMGHIDVQREVLDSLIDIKYQLIEEISEHDNLNYIDDEKVIQKLQYQIQHLKNNYKTLFDSTEQEKIELKNEIEKNKLLLNEKMKKPNQL